MSFDSRVARLTLWWLRRLYKTTITDESNRGDFLVKVGVPFHALLTDAGHAGKIEGVYTPLRLEIRFKTVHSMVEFSLSLSSPLSPLSLSPTLSPYSLKHRCRSHAVLQEEK